MIHTAKQDKKETLTKYQILIFQEINTSIVSFNREDRLRLIDFDKSFDYNIIKNCINSCQISIQDIRNYHGSTEFKLQGTPFYCSGWEAVQTRRLIIRIFVSF